MWNTQRMEGQKIVSRVSGMSNWRCLERQTSRGNVGTQGWTRTVGVEESLIVAGPGVLCGCVNDGGGEYAAPENSLKTESLECQLPCWATEGRRKAL